MRMILNITAVLLCGALAGGAAMMRSEPSRAASVSDGLPVMAGHDDPNEIRIRHSSSVEAHFTAANVSHDGHLTKDQAQQGDWPRVVKHFDEIDSDHKGWVSAEQIHAFNKSHHKHRKEATA